MDTNTYILGQLLILSKKIFQGLKQGKDVKKLEPLCTVGKNVKWCSCYRKQYSNASKN